MSRVTLGGSLEGMQCYADFEADLSRWKIIRRNVCTAVAYRDSWGKERAADTCLVTPYTSYLLREFQ